jgi:NAD(P)H-binding
MKSVHDHPELRGHGPATARCTGSWAATGVRRIVAISASPVCTVLRPPLLTGKPLTGRYRTAAGQNVRGGRSIPRADVAHYMLAVLVQADTIGQVIGIAT